MDTDVHVVEVVPVPVDDLVAVHEASAAVAYAHIFDDPFPRDEVRERWARHRGRVVVARRGGTVVGFAAATGDLLEGLYVVPEETGSGLGTTLVDAVGPVSRLWVLEANTAGRRFYERRGWRWSGETREGDDAGGLTELLYHR